LITIKPTLTAPIESQTSIDVEDFLMTAQILGLSSKVNKFNQHYNLEVAVFSKLSFVIFLHFLSFLSVMPGSTFAQVSAEAETAAAIARIEKLNPLLNAVIAVDPEALEQARALDRAKTTRGPLFGIPILVKDNIETKGKLPTTAGSLALKDNVTGRDAPVVEQLRSAGAIILGKANLSEWANLRSSVWISGWSAVGGQTRNPHVLDRTPCGSSSGSAVAVASGMVIAAIGTDTDGSINCPAAINGIVGLRPTVGLVSRSHIVPGSHSQDTAGPLTKDVRMAARVLTAIAGGDPSDAATKEADAHKENYIAALDANSLKGKRIGVLRFAAGLSASVDTLFEQALGVLKSEGAILIDIKEFEDLQRIAKEEEKVLLTELKADLNAYLATTPLAVKTRTLTQIIAFNRDNSDSEMALIGQEFFEKADATKGLDDPNYRASRALSYQLAGPNGIDRMLADNNVIALVFPTITSAWKIDVANGDAFPNVPWAGSLAAVAGYPHLTVPMGEFKHLPVGLSFVGPPWSEARLLGLGYAYEQAAKLTLTPTLIPSIEESPEISKHLQPAAKQP
jgi:amidase